MSTKAVPSRSRVILKGSPKDAAAIGSAGILPAGLRGTGCQPVGLGGASRRLPAGSRRSQSLARNHSPKKQRGIFFVFSQPARLQINLAPFKTRASRHA